MLYFVQSRAVQKKFESLFVLAELPSSRTSMKTKYNPWCESPNGVYKFVVIFFLHLKWSEVSVRSFDYLWYIPGDIGYCIISHAYRSKSGPKAKYSGVAEMGGKEEV